MNEGRKVRVVMFRFFGLKQTDCVSLLFAMGPQEGMSYRCRLDRLPNSVKLILKFVGNLLEAFSLFLAVLIRCCFFLFFSFFFLRSFLRFSLSFALSFL